MPPEAVPQLISATEEAILKAVWQYPYLTALDAMHLLGFTSLGHVRRLVSKLSGERDADNRYLLSLPIPDSRAGGVERCYLLSRDGRELVAALGLPVDGYFRPSKTRVISFSHLMHELLVNRTVIAGVRFSRGQRAFALTDTRLSAEVAAEVPALSAIPDAWLLFEDENGKKHPIWMEIDNSTEYFKHFSELLQARIACLTSGAYTQAFPEARGAVVFAYAVAGRPWQAETRRRTLQRWTMQVLAEREMAHWAGLFRFTSVVFAKVYEQGLFENAIWFRPDDPERAVPLLTPAEGNGKEMR